tara:strand:- start:1708 stop:2001 length:294 start_codon:yes stop_codon:yes gene_type:complete
MAKWNDDGWLDMEQRRLDANQSRALEKMADRPPVGTYHEGERQRCGQCNGLQWYIGRLVAECANERCGNAVPLADVMIQPNGSQGFEVGKRAGERKL